MVLHLNKLESPSCTQGCTVGGLVKIGPWFWRRRFLNFVNVFLLFCNYLPLEKDGALHWNKLEFPHPRMLCAKFGWNWPLRLMWAKNKYAKQIQCLDNFRKALIYNSALFKNYTNCKHVMHTQSSFFLGASARLLFQQLFIFLIGK